MEADFVSGAEASVHSDLVRSLCSCGERIHLRGVCDGEDCSYHSDQKAKRKRKELGPQHPLSRPCIDVTPFH